ncbi:hypothetical protein EDD15DRAFT_2414469 [Pisolithus albus]|nr:hypothetical protein EDD15DRAFT_2414469 [Pisolithus albus]
MAVDTIFPVQRSFPSDRTTSAPCNGVSRTLSEKDGFADGKSVSRGRLPPPPSKSVPLPVSAPTPQPVVAAPTTGPASGPEGGSVQFIAPSKLELVNRKGEEALWKYFLENPMRSSNEDSAHIDHIMAELAQTYFSDNPDAWLHKNSDAFRRTSKNRLTDITRMFKSTAQSMIKSYYDLEVPIECRVNLTSLWAQKVTELLDDWRYVDGPGSTTFPGLVVNGAFNHPALHHLITETTWNPPKDLHLFLPHGEAKLDNIIAYTSTLLYWALENFRLGRVNDFKTQVYGPIYASVLDRIRRIRAGNDLTAAACLDSVEQNLRARGSELLAHWKPIHQAFRTFTIMVVDDTTASAFLSDPTFGGDVLAAALAGASLQKQMHGAAWIIRFCGGCLHMKQWKLLPFGVAITSPVDRGWLHALPACKLHVRVVGPRSALNDDSDAFSVNEKIIPCTPDANDDAESARSFLMYTVLFRTTLKSFNNCLPDRVLPRTASVITHHFSFVSRRGGMSLKSQCDAIIEEMLRSYLEILNETSHILRANNCTRTAHAGKIIFSALTMNPASGLPALHNKEAYTSKKTPRLW